MSIIKWNSNFPMVWPSILDEFDSWPQISNKAVLDIYETDDSIVVEAPVPGIPEDKVDVTIEGNVLNISASYEETDEEKKKKKVVYKSSRQTSFNYSTSLPRMVRGSEATAVVDNGIVRVTIPKTEEEKPKRIEVKKK